jgi:ribonuclease D
MRDATLITTAEQPDAAVFRMRGATRLALDTEFMRERTYYPQLCLIQVATDADCVLVDPLNGLDLTELLELLAEPGRVKVVHAARQDLEVLYLAGGHVPLPVFDTQIAAALVGLTPQIGYAELVARQPATGRQGADAHRLVAPAVTPEQLAYAADDVHHLLELHNSLLAELQKRGRQHWLDEDAAAFADETLYRTEPADAWRRLKGIGRLKPTERAIARAVARWREERAIASDKPRGWILPDEALFAMAALAPRSLDELATVRALQPAVHRKRGEELLALIDAARETTDDLAAADLSGRRPEPGENALVARLIDEVRAEAARLGISGELLATRRDVEALVLGAADPAILRGWRRGAIGERLLAAAAAAGVRPPQATHGIPPSPP